MLQLRNTVFFLLFCLSLPIFGQKQDSLSKKTYKYFNNKLDSLEHELGSELNWIYVNAYINKAKAENNFKNLFHGYKSAIFQTDSLKKEYADSVILIAEKTNDSSLIGRAFDIKAGVYYDYKQYNKALDYYLKAENTLKNTNNEYSKHSVSYSIGVIKMYLGHFEEAEELFKEAKEYFKSVDNNNHRLLYLRSLYRLGEINQFTHQYKEATTINLLGLQEALSIEQKYQEMYFNLGIGIDNYLAKEYELAIQHIQKSIPTLEGLGDFDVVQKAEFYLGESFLALNHEEKALESFQKVDSLFIKNGFLNPIARGSYERLIDFYKEKNDKDKQLYYINQLLEADKINAENNQQLAYTLNKEYDTKRLLENKAQLEKQFANWRIYAISGLSLVLLGAVYFFIQYRKTKNKHQKLHQRYEELIHKKQEIKTNVTETPTEISKKQEIPEEVIEDILKKIEKFENENEFLNPKIDQKYLAKKFKTNTSYLSKIINSQKSKNFSSYLNTLRINYIIELLKNEPQYRLYTVQALAEHCGYTNSRQFSDAFYTETGLRPAYFIEQIQKEQEVIVIGDE